MMQLTLGLLFVLALIVALGWSVSRLRGLRPTGMSPIRVVGAASVGTRERVVIVDTGGQWLVLGVAAGSVTLLDKTLPQSLPREGALPPELPKFAAWLKQAMDKKAR